MSELCWAEAVIPKDRDPEWTVAHSFVDELTATAIAYAIPDYHSKISDEALAGAGLASHWEYEYEKRDIVECPALAGLIKSALHADLDQVADAIDFGQWLLASFQVDDLIVFTYYSGFSTSGPDALCEAWLDLESLGVLGSAGFLPTRATGGWWERRAKARERSPT